MAVIHITEAEAARDFSAVLAKASAGEEVQIKGATDTFALVRVERWRKDEPRLLSDVLADLEKSGSNALLDDQWGNDLEAVIRLHEHERLIDPWESF